MKIRSFSLGMMGTNSYSVYDCPSPFIVDAPDGIETEIEFLNKTGIKPSAVLLTHAHFDHIAGLPALIESFPEIRIHVSKEDMFLVENDYERTVGLIDYCFPMYMGVFFPNRMPGISEFEDYGDEIFSLKVLRTPGHTPGSVSFYDEKESLLFSGDTLFKCGIGRTDLYGDASEMSTSLGKILSLPECTVVLSGHGPVTNIGDEKKYF